MRYLDYLATLQPPSTAQDARDRSSLEHLLAGLEAHAGGPVDLTKARWPAVARRVLHAGTAELDEIHAALRGGTDARHVFQVQVHAPDPAPPVSPVHPSE